MQMVSDLLGALEHEFGENVRLHQLSRYALPALFIQTTAALVLRMFAVAGLL